MSYYADGVAVQANSFCLISMIAVRDKIVNRSCPYSILCCCVAHFSHVLLKRQEDDTLQLAAKALTKCPAV